MIDYQQAMADPARHFENPGKILDCKDLSKEEKINILRQWEFDEREREVAEEENMAPGAAVDCLRDVLLALHQLVPVDVEHSPPTKQGGGDDG